LERKTTKKENYTENIKRTKELSGLKLIANYYTAETFCIDSDPKKPQWVDKECNGVSEAQVGLCQMSRKVGRKSRPSKESVFITILLITIHIHIALYGKQKPKEQNNSE
jgi:hypothetical protein